MKIYRTVNPVAYENTYYLENDHSLILVDPGSDWATIQKQIDRIGKPIVATCLCPFSRSQLVVFSCR